jgi:hypothetical protein
MDQYLNDLHIKEIKFYISRYEKPKGKKLTGLKRHELEDVLRDLMLHGKLKCMAGCKKGHCDCYYTKKQIEGAGIMDFFKKPKKDYTNGSKSTIKKYGSLPIVGLEVVRTPILSVLDRVINIISFGKFHKLKKKYNFDDLFHLQLIAKVNMDGHYKNVVLEKNEVINISTSVSTKNTSQMINVPLQNKQLTINDLITKGRADAGDAKWFLYDGLKNNCQDFIMMVLGSSGLLSPDVSAFIKQDVSKIADGLPAHVKKAMNLTTDLGARVSQAIGAGRQTNEYWKNKTSNDDFWKQQGNLRKGILDEKEKANKGKVSELDKYKNEQIQKVKDEVAEYERTHGNSGNFLKDAVWGFNEGKRRFVDPVNKVVQKAAPVLNFVPGGKAVATSLDYFDKGANALNSVVGSGNQARRAMMFE